MTRQVKALGSSSRPLLFPTPLPLLLLLLLLQRTGDIEKSIRLCCRAKNWSFLNRVEVGEGRWVGQVAQPGVDCCHLLEGEELVLVQLDGEGGEGDPLLHHPVQAGKVGRLPAPLRLNLSSLSPSKESLGPRHLERDSGSKESERHPPKPALVFTHSGF